MQVLVHAGTGGVGLAAIQVAQAAGLGLHTTAGTPAKRAHLRGLGISAVAESRNTGFTDAVTLATAGSGIDLALNSLTSPGKLCLSSTS